MLYGRGKWELIKSSLGFTLSDNDIIPQKIVLLIIGHICTIHQSSVNFRKIYVFCQYILSKEIELSDKKF